MATAPTAKWEVWGQDEGRMGLKPVLRRVWARRGERPVALQRPRYQWLYVYGFVRPITGETHLLLMPGVCVEQFELALQHFAKHRGVGPDLQIVLVVDGAGWHSAKGLRVPEGIHLVFQPPYSPQLQPAERLWPLIHEAIANRVHDDIDHLWDDIAKRTAWIEERPQIVQPLTNFYWWEEASPR